MPCEIAWPEGLSPLKPFESPKEAWEYTAVEEEIDLHTHRLNPEELKPVHDWVKTYERFWTHQIGRIKERAERKALERIARVNQQPKTNE